MDLEAQLRDARSERSLLMSYSASLGFFEYQLLDLLQRTGAGAVTLLLDGRQLIETFSEKGSLRYAGRRYRVHPVPTSHNTSFHPKLYLLWHRDSVVLWIASANLTVTGLRDNLELVDRANLLPDGSGNPRTFFGYVEFLRSLPKALSLPEAAREELSRIAADIDKWLPDVPPPTGPEFLHSIERPLLDQLTDRLPRDVTQIRIVSPFFDGRSEAIRELAERFPSARLTIFKRGGIETDLAGKALNSIRDRVELFAVHGQQEHLASLHGKLLLFERGESAWTVTGSANCTAPALLRCASDIKRPGNVEAVLMRKLRSRASGVERLFDSLEAELIEKPLSHFTYEGSPFDHDPTALTVLDAQLVGSRLKVEILTPASAGRDDSVSATVRLHASAQAPKELEVQELEFEEAGVIVAETEDIGQTTLDGPCEVQIQFRDADGRDYAGRTWLSRPELLGKSSRERALSRTLRAYRARGEGDEEYYKAWPDYFWNLARALVSAEGRIVDPPGKVGESLVDEGTPGDDEDDAGASESNSNSPQHAPEDLVVDEAAMPVHRRYGHAGTELRSLNDFIEHFDAWFEIHEEAAIDAEISRGRPESQSQALENADTIGRQGRSPAEIARGRWNQIEEGFEHEFSALFDRPPQQATVGGAWDLTEGALRFLFGAYCDESQNVSTSEEPECPRFRRSIASLAAATVSLHGTLRGTPRGFFIQALTCDNSELVEHFREVLGRGIPAERFARTAAIVAAAVALDWKLDSADEETGLNTLAGLLILGKHVPSWREHLRFSARSLTERLPVDLHPRAIPETLRPRSAVEIPEIREVRAWMLFERLRTEELTSETAERFREILRRIDRNLYRLLERHEQGEALSFGSLESADDSRTFLCGACYVELPTGPAQQCQDGRVVACQMCGAHLVPLRAESHVIEAVMSEFGVDGIAESG